MIPDDVRHDMKDIYAHLLLVGAPDKIRDASERVARYIISQPTAPEPDWSTASPDTQYHTIDASGLGIWWDTSHPPQTVGLLWEPDELDKEQQYPMIVDYVYDLPLGIDWRTTLRRRPEGTA